MKIDIFNVDEFVQLNNLREVTSPVLFQRGDIPDPNGLVSNEIFGVTIKDRKETFAYIDLGGHFFHPHIYKVLKRIFRNVEKIVNGSMYVVIEKGILRPVDEGGETGIEFLYNNWDKIDWVKSEDAGMRNERIDLITKSKKDEVFLSKVIVIPAFYRDIKNSSRGGGETVELNTFYTKLIRYASMLKEQNMFDFVFHQMNWNIQNTIVEVYDYFKTKLEKKSGMIRKYLMGKSVDYCTRTVITEPIFHANKPSDMKITFDYSGIPLYQAISLLYPFVLRWVKNWFELNVISMNELSFSTPRGDIESKTVQLSHPENFYTDKYFRKIFDQYIRDPESRFDPIAVPLADGSTKYLAFTGRKFESDTNREVASIANRRMTWTDVLYMACYDCCKNKHCLVTRYPVSDVYGTFISRLEVISTQETEIMQVGDQIYKFYPHIVEGLKPEDVAVQFVDSMQFSLSYLKGLGDGDYDGDQVTVKIAWTEEANKECEEVMNRKSYLLGTSGMIIRRVEKEASQTLYAMTKDYDGRKNRSLTPVEKKTLLDMKPDDFTFEYLVNTFGVVSDGKSVFSPKFKCGDRFVLNPGEYPGVKEATTTTIGRYVFNVVLFKEREFVNDIGYINSTMTDDAFKKVEKSISRLLLFDMCSTDDVKRYIDRRDWLCLQLHSVITTSFTEGVIKIPKEVKQLRDELFKKYADELKSGNAKVMSEIENQLVAKTKEVLKDDPGMDLYNSGARGSVGNNMKNMLIVRGAVSDPSTGEFVNVLSALNDGMRKEDIPSASNIIVSGAYPKAVGTAVSGYVSKQLLSACQTEIADEDSNSDCGTKRGVRTYISEHNYEKYIYRYIMVNGKPVKLDDFNIRSYIGKVVELRSPMSCLKTKHGCLCHYCVGDFPYMIGNLNIGLSGSKVGTTLTNLGMKKFHNNVIKYRKLNPEEMLI